jgi:DNA gyrase/topoisomerase IV subunit B
MAKQNRVYNFNLYSKSGIVATVAYKVLEDGTCNFQVSIPILKRQGDELVKDQFDRQTGIRQAVAYLEEKPYVLKEKVVSTDGHHDGQTVRQLVFDALKHKGRGAERLRKASLHALKYKGLVQV